MKSRFVFAVTAVLVVLGSVAVAQGPDGKARSAADRVKEDIAGHRRLAEVHEAAARCLEAGKTEKVCHDELAKACQGVGIGRHCGMRHRH